MSEHVSDNTIFPFLELSGEIRNQIYLDIVGPKLPRPLYCEEYFRPDRRFNTAFFTLNRQVSREFSDILWNVLSVEWKNNKFELNREDVARFTSMKRLQRCKLILELQFTFRYPSTERAAHDHTRRNLTTEAMPVECTVFGLGHKLNRMPHLKEIHLEYEGYDGDFDIDYFLWYRDGSLIRWSGDDLMTVFADNLRGMKKVQVSGTLCCECAALVATAMERPKEVLSEFHATEPDKCLPRSTVPQWCDKARGWI
ncbi:MAG: hypothetical protein Q9209_007211 [Squamulea sp. 1 TL-2023]